MSLNIWARARQSRAIPYKLPHNLLRAVDGGHVRVCVHAIAHGSVTSLPMGQLVKAPWVPKNKIWKIIWKYGTKTIFFIFLFLSPHGPISYM